MVVKELTKLSVADLWREYQNSFKDLWQGSDEVMKNMKKTFLESALRAEKWEHTGCSEYERSSSRKDYRNGYWHRWIILKEGRLQLRMPRVKK